MKKLIVNSNKICIHIVYYYCANKNYEIKASVFLSVLHSLKGFHPIIFVSNIFHNSHLIKKCIHNQLKLYSNLFTTYDPPKYSNYNSPNLCFCLLKGDKKTFSLVQKIFSTNKNVFLSPFNKQKQRFGELEFKYFGGSDVANKLKVYKKVKCY